MQALDKQGLNIFLDELSAILSLKIKLKSTTVREQMVNFNYDDILKFDTQATNSSSVIGMGQIGIMVIGNP